MNEIMETSEKELLWEVVRDVNWPTDYDRVKAKILRVMAPVQVEQLQNEFDLARSALYAAADDVDYNGYVSDDGLDDTICHIIGLGPWTYEQALADPKQIFERCTEGDYKESFAYAIPSTDDYRYISNGYYAMQAGIYERQLRKVIDDPVYSELLKERVMKAVRMLSKFVYLNAEERSALVKISELLREANVDETPGYGIDNLVSDWENFMETNNS